MRQKNKDHQKPLLQELGVQCNLQGSEEGLTSFLKDRNDQLKLEMENLRVEKLELRRQLKELGDCIETLKHATVKQFINKNHVELDMEDNFSESNPPDMAFMIDIV